MKRSSRAGRLTQLERNQRTTGIFFILPSLVLCAIFMVVPLINVIRYSLTDWDGLSKTYNFVGLYNYMHLHEIEGFGEMMLATVTFAIGVTAITIIVSFLAALALDKRGRDRLPRGLMRALWFNAFDHTENFLLRLPGIRLRTRLRAVGRAAAHHRADLSRSARRAS